APRAPEITQEPAELQRPPEAQLGRRRVGDGPRFGRHLFRSWRLRRRTAWAPLASCRGDTLLDCRSLTATSVARQRPGTRLRATVGSPPCPRSSADRASASGAVCAGSSPAEGASPYSGRRSGRDTTSSATRTRVRRYD